MTWNEFKAEVDRQLENQDLDGSVEIWFIDVTLPKDLDVEGNGVNGMTIT